MIYCAKETEEDWKTFIEELTELIQIRTEMGSNTSISMTFCLTEDALVPVKNRGLISVAELEVGDVLDGVEPSKVLSLVEPKEEAIYRIKTHLGCTIRGNDKHPVLVNTGYKKTRTTGLLVI